MRLKAARGPIAVLASDLGSGGGGVFVALEESRIQTRLLSGKRRCFRSRWPLATRVWTLNFLFTCRRARESARRRAELSPSQQQVYISD